MRVYHAIITTVFLYASPVYGCLPSTLLSKLERFQRRAHRIVCGPTCDCNHFPPLSSKFEAAALQLLLRAETNNYHPLHELVPPRLPASNKLRMPACATSRRLNSFLSWSILLHNDLTLPIAIRLLILCSLNSFISECICVLRMCISDYQSLKNKRHYLILSYLTYQQATFTSKDTRTNKQHSHLRTRAPTNNIHI